MLEILRKIHRQLWCFKHNTLTPIKWHYQSLFIRAISSNKGAKLIDTKKKYLILAPHSDDEWIGCSQIIIQCKNTTICNMNMQGGDTVEIHKMRYNEMLSVANRFKRKFITLTDDKVANLQNVICQEKPDFILVPHFIDWHPEHLAVMEILKQLVSNGYYTGQILTYQVSIPFVNGRKCLYLPMTKDQQRFKWKTFYEHYNTQSFMPIKRFIANEYINGANISSNGAELYKQYVAEEWVRAMDFFNEHIETRNFLKKNINNIFSIRRMISSVYKSKSMYHG